MAAQTTKPWNDINLPVFSSGKKVDAPAKKFITGVDDSELSKEEPEPEVRLISAEWKPGPKGFQHNEQCFLDVKAEYLKKTIRARIRGRLFGILDGEEIDLAQEVEGFIDSETNVARMDIKKLWFMHLDHYKAWLKDKDTPSKYTIKGISHSRGVNKIDSPVLDMPAPGPIDKIKVIITDLPNSFAPSVESCIIKYQTKDGDPPAGSKGTVTIKDSSGKIVLEKKDLPLGKNKEQSFAWDGKGADGKYLNHENGPFVVTIHQTGESSTKSEEKKLSIEIAEIQLELKGINANNQFIENALEKEIEVIATVFIKKTDGSKIVSQAPITVEFSFSDPAPANTNKVNSHSSGGIFLGKANDASALFWKQNPGCATSSIDSFKTKCKVVTITTAGSTDLGKAKVFFKPSNVGGDNYKIIATVYAADGKTILKSKDTTIFSIWRKIELSAYEMRGFSHVTTHGTEVKMSGYYTNDTYTKYIRGAMNAIGAAYCVKYFGLWDHATSTQKSWVTECQKKPTETPTADESTKANGPAGPDQTTARTAITIKAQAWQVRIFNNMMSSLNTWAIDAGIPPNSIIALEYCHPKYDSQSPNTDAITSEWSQYPWLKITYDGSLIHPDHRWDQAQSFAYDKRAYILAGMTAARYEVVIAHEVGHVTKKQFARAEFGGGDHSTVPGLMDPTGSLASFTSKEKKILRGFKP